MASKKKTHKAEAEVVAVNKKELPKRLGLLLRNADGEEKWFSMWKNDRDSLPTSLRRGDRVSISYTAKLGDNGKGPFLNIADLQVLTPAESDEEQASAPSIKDLEIRANVALKAAARVSFAQNGDEILELADKFYNWISDKVATGTD